MNKNFDIRARTVNDVLSLTDLDNDPPKYDRKRDEAELNPSACDNTFEWPDEVINGSVLQHQQQQQQHSEQSNVVALSFLIILIIPLARYRSLIYLTTSLSPLEL